MKSIKFLINKFFCISFFFVSLSCFAQLSPLTIGTIHPGDSIVIKYNVTINNPLSPPSTTQISNQGTVVGSNFSNVLTDDPDTGPAGDATITLLNVYPLPLRLISFSGQVLSNEVVLQWKTAEEAGIEKYEVERSTDGTSFSKTGELLARNSGSQSEQYSFSDHLPVTGTVYYRIRIIEPGLPSKYSSVLRFSSANEQPGIRVYPNPVVQRIFALQFNKAEKGVYRLQLISSSGQQVYMQQILHPGGTAVYTISLPAGTAGGIYGLRLLGEKAILVHTITIQ